MSKDFFAHHCVNQLMNLLKVQNGANAAETTDYLLNNRTQFVTTQVNTHEASVHVTEKASKPEEFKKKLEFLKLKNVRNLDSIIYFLSQTVDKPHLKQALVQCADDIGEADKMIPRLLRVPGAGVSLPPSGSELSTKELQELRNNLEKATVKPHSNAHAFRKKLEDRQQQQGRGLSFPIPSHPQWFAGPKKKSFLTNDFPFDPTSKIKAGTPIGNLPHPLQEAEIVKDLLFVLIGIEGNHILVRRDGDATKARNFIVDSSLDISLAEMTKNILPIASSYSIVVNFIEERSLFEYGYVNHALCSAMKKILQNYRIMVAQLDDEHRRCGLSLQRLLLLLQPAIQQLNQLAVLSSTVERANCVGGAVLSLIHNGIAASVGDESREKLYRYLAQVANVPYLEMLGKWIYKGEIDDCYGEFLVEENSNFSKDLLQDEYNDQYWESRYTLCRDRIPNYLEQVADRVLSTGKYLNVVHECGKTIKSLHAREIRYDPINKDFIHQIDEAHSYASQLLLDLLLQEHNLWARLRSLKTYFLLNDGDFLLTFMDLTETEMRMDVRDIAPNRLEALLELSLRTSMSDHDPYKDDLKIDLLQYDLITQLVRILSIDTVDEKVIKGLDPNELNLTGLESVALDYEVKWPLSLVISRKTLTKYQMIFRHLHYCKHVERYLSKVWLSFKHTKKSFLNKRPWSRKAMSLLQRLFYFVRNYQDYMINEVLEPNWLQLENNVKTARNIDEILDFHTDFLRQSLQDCLLTNRELLNRQNKLLMLCVAFSNFMLDLYRQIEGTRGKDELEHSTLSGPPTSKDKKKETSRLATKEKHTDFDLDDMANQAIDRVKKIERDFNKLFIGLLHDVERLSREQGQHCLVNMLDKLDYNGYYRSMMKENEDLVQM